MGLRNKTVDKGKLIIAKLKLKPFKPLFFGFEWQIFVQGGKVRVDGQNTPTILERTIGPF